MGVNNPIKVILHCSDTDDSPESKVTIKDVDAWHKARGWNGVGYHYFIRRNGMIETGRSEKEIGAHVEGHNKDSLGICYEGRMFPTVAQLQSIITLYRRILATYKISHHDWYGHYEFNPKKTCPGFSMPILRNILKGVLTSQPYQSVEIARAE